MNEALITIGFLVIAIAGFFVGRWHGMSTRSKSLSEALEQKEEELNELKSDVNNHFSETARLFTNLTTEYKSLYKHLAKGANELSDESFKLTLSAPNENLIDHEADEITDIEPSDLLSDENLANAPQQPVDYVKNSDETVSESDDGEKESDVDNDNSSDNGDESEPKTESKV